MTKQQIGEFVLNKRKEMKLTQKELAEKLGIRRQAIIEIEQAQCNYGIEALLQVLNGLGCELKPSAIVTKRFKFSETKSLTK